MNRRTLLGAGALGLGGAALLLSARSERGSPLAQVIEEESLRDFRTRAPEGGRVILDRARYPQTFQEAPMLAELVRQGKLPPVHERIGQDPIVVEPLHEIGRYGGTLRRAFVGPGDAQVATRFAAGPDALLFWTHDWKTLRPNIARDFEISADGRVTTLFLRRGLRWSDGAPFTADDILFWYEDMYLDRRVTASPVAPLRIDDQDVRIEKVDDFTVQFIAPQPYFLLAEMLAGYTEIAGPSAMGRAGFGGFGPKHYLEQFHPKYSDEARLTRTARAAGFANWSIYLKNRYDWAYNPELPVISPWRVVSPVNTQNFAFTRNPYSVWVDTAGNQLPYIDHVTHLYCSGADAVNFKAAAGDLDFQERHLHISKLPFLLHNRRRSRYQVYLDPFEGTDLGLRINLAHRQDPEIGALLGNPTFRRALSLACDREQINETFMYGTGLPSAAVPAPQGKYYPGVEWSQRWAVRDLEQANLLLDSIGLTERDSQGYRLRRDRTDRVRLVCSTLHDQFDYPAVSEMLRDQWLPIGIDLDTRIIEQTLWLQRAMSGEMQVTLQFTGAEDPFTFPDFLFPYNQFASGSVVGPEFARWFQSNGASGVRPPDEIVAIMELWRHGRLAPPDERIRVGQERVGQELIRRHVDLVLSIGLVSSGLSIYGIHIAKKALGNVPRRFVNTHVVRSPATALPMTFFYRADADAVDG
jgi:peptide/nickel transport system substrate-binding protein